MKNKLSILVLCLFAASGHAQTFVRYTITNFQQVAYVGNGYTNYDYETTMTFLVPSNTIMKATILSGDLCFGSIQAVYPESTNSIGLGSNQTGNSQVVPVLGPATILFTGFDQDIAYYGPVICIAEFDPVNVAPANTGFAVQPANSLAQISLESSTDLKTWSASTPGTYGLTNSARFFRLNLNVR